MPELIAALESEIACVADMASGTHGCSDEDERAARMYLRGIEEGLRKAVVMAKDMMVNVNDERRPDTVAAATPTLSVAEAMELDVCRLCGEPLGDAPVVLNFGSECAHEGCFDEWARSVTSAG